MQLPEGYTFRPLELSDYSNNYIEVLKVLTSVGEIPSDKFSELFSYWRSHPDAYHPHVIANKEGTVVATGMLLVERKLIHECGLVGHIEDIAVAREEQGKKLGISMILGLSELAKKENCYKAILDCSPHNVKFYEKCGYTNSGSEMVLRF